MKAELLPIAKLTPDEANARRHDRRNIEAIKASLQRFGQTRPLVVTQDLTVIAGNGTLAAMTELGFEQAAVTRVPFATPDEARAFALADNKTAELAQWNTPVLLEALESLALEGWPVGELGFEPQDLAGLGRRFEKVAPEFFPAFDQDIETLYCCPRCAYEWSGRQE